MLSSTTMAHLKKPKTHSTALNHLAFINHTTVRRCTISHAAAKISCICQMSKILFGQPNSQPFLCFYPFSKKTHGYLCCGDPIFTWAVFRLACGLQFSTRPFGWHSNDKWIKVVCQTIATRIGKPLFHPSNPSGPLLIVYTCVYRGIQWFCCMVW